jgi:hypothetical protein
MPMRNLFGPSRRIRSRSAHGLILVSAELPVLVLRSPASNSFAHANRSSSAINSICCSILPRRLNAYRLQVPRQSSHRRQLVQQPR